MSIPASVMLKLATLGLSKEQAETVADMLSDVEKATMEAAETVLEKSREKTRARVQKWREKKAAEDDVTLPNVTSVTKQLVRDPARGSDNLQTKRQPEQEVKEERDAPARPFVSFWDLYPHKVGKREAEPAFTRALSRAPFEIIMAGLRRYAAKTDDRPWCNPATWLNGDRWEDQPAEPIPRNTGPPRGGRQNAVEANVSRRIRRNEPDGGRRDNGDVEFLPPDKPELRRVLGDLGAALRVDTGPGRH